MAIAEVIAGLSLTLAFAIPTFFDKVMRPGYTKKVNAYRKDLTEQVQSSLEKALDEIKQDEEMSEETSYMLDDVADLWFDVRGKINKLDMLLNFRSFLFLLCILALFTSLMGIYSNQFTNPIKGFDWVNSAFWLFMLILGFLLYYGYQIFDFDRELTRYSLEKREIVHEKFGKSPTLIKGEGVSAMEKEENRYSQLLENNNIPFEKDPKVGRFYFDFVVPSMRNPKVLIEIKLFGEKFSYSRVNRLLVMSLRVKESYPDSKLILLTNPSKIKKKLVREIEGFYGKIFDIENPKEFLKYLSKELS